MSQSSDLPTNAPQVPVTKSRWLIPVGCVTIAGLFIGLPLIALIIANSQSAHRVEEHLKKMRAAGEPTTTAELEELYDVPSDKVDTTALWTEAISFLESGGFQQAANDLPIVGSGDRTIPPPGESWAQLESAEQLITQFQFALDKMHEAGRLKNGSARFELDFDEGFSMKVPHVEHLRSAARLLSLEAHVHAHRGNTDGVVRSLNSMLAAADALENEPLLVTRLVGIAFYGMATADFSELLPQCDFTDEQLDKLAKRFERGERPKSLTTALLGERVFGMNAIRDPQKVMPDVPRLPFANDNLAVYLDYLGQAVEASRMPYPESLDEAARINGELRDQVGRGGIQKVRYMVAMMLVPAFDQALVATARETANSRLVRTLIAAERFQRREGRFPADLNELVPTFLPSVPLDPCDGKPLRYFANELECKIYSLGANRVDDGGKAAENLDDVLTLKRRTSK